MVKIGLIDSGIGGMSILKAIIDNGIEAEFIYILDNKYMPYGNRSKTELTAIAFKNIERLIASGVEIIIFACNTLTSSCVNEMRRIFNIPIIGTEPPVKPCAYDCQRIAVLATPLTLKSDNINHLINTYNIPEYYFPNCSCLAECIETYFCNDDAITDCIGVELQKYNFCDGVVLGCTHYNFITHIISKAMGCPKIFTSSKGVVDRLKIILGKEIVDSKIERNNILHNNLSKVKVLTTKKELPSENCYKLCKYIEIPIEFIRIM